MIPLQPLRETELPQRSLSFWRMTGPGAVLVGLSIGAGELVIWPWITAKFGATMAWAALLGVFIQLWINLEIGRWTLVTGESPLTGFARVWRGLVGVFLFITFVYMFLPAWARTSGAALKALIFGPDGPGPDWVWTSLTFCGIAFVLFGPKTVYRGVEKAISAMVILITLGMIVVVARVASWDSLMEMLRGSVNFGHIELDNEFPFSRFFSAVVFAGAGGLGNLYYAYYLRDKQIGMGAKVPRLVNPLRGHDEAGTGEGYIYRESEENGRRFRDWFRFIILDQTMYFWLLNSFTMFLFMFGALAVLHPQGLVPAEGRLVWDLAVMLESSMGTVGRYLFLVIGMAALFSTQLTTVDGGARVFADMLRTNFSFARKIEESRWYLWSAITIMFFGIVSTWFLERFEITALGFIFNAALISGFAMAIYCPVTLWMNLRLLPKSARPKPLNIAMTAIASTIYVAFALYTLYTMVVG